MDSKYAVVTLKVLIWVLFIIGGGLDLLILVPMALESGLDLWTLSFLPLSVIHFVGGLYIILHFDKLPKWRLTVIKAFVALFVAETIMRS
jgi:hypothetical protein